MSNLSVFKSDDGIEVIIDQHTGESFCSVSGYARMSGLTQQGVSKRVKKLDNSDLVKNAEIDTGYGVKLHNLITECLVSDWIVDDNPAMAKQLLKAGVRVFLHKLAGYKVTSEAIQLQPQTPAEMLVVFAQQLVEQERRSKELAEKQQMLESKTEVLDERTEHLQNRIEALNGASNYYTVRGYCRVKNIKIAEGMARQVAFAAKRICKSQGFNIGKVPDERHGEVNSYPDTVLAEAIASALKAS
jgi:hypothetical protein